MVIKNTKSDKLGQTKKFQKNDTTYSSFWLYKKDVEDELKDRFVDYYSRKELLSEFNPFVGKSIINYWSEYGDFILDPFAGRSRVLISNKLGRQYLGFDVSKDVTNYLEPLMLDFEVQSVVNDDSINIDEYLPDEFVDMIFTCPPYWNLEKYQSCKGQLSDENNYERFLDKLMLRFSKCITKLKSNKYLCIVVGDFRRNGEYITFHSDLIERFKKLNNVKLHDLIVIQNLPLHTAAFYFGTRKKNKQVSKSHEYLLIYKKVDSSS